MKKKSKVLKTLFFSLIIAGSGYAKIASAACFTFYTLNGSATAICW